jgi:methanethiol S-methyltransferase
MKRALILAYGAVSYVVFFATFVYAIGFVGDLWVPKTIDGDPQVPLLTALLINAGLLGLFAVQHSVMARPAFKRMITKIIPKAAERSTYVLASSLALIALFWYWEPMGGVVWHVEDPVGRALLYGGFAFGWGLVLVVTFLISHFDLFGLRQVWLEFVNKPYKPVGFVTPGPYKIVRHPLYVGWFFAFWCTPVMTVTHLVFAIATTAYILIAIQLEERDLARALPQYDAYRARVPMLVPRLSKDRRWQEGSANADA